MEGLFLFILEFLGGIILEFLTQMIIYPFFRFIGFLVRLAFNFKKKSRIELRTHHNNGLLGFVTVFFGLIILIPVVVYAVGK